MIRFLGNEILNLFYDSSILEASLEEIQAEQSRDSTLI